MSSVPKSAILRIFKALHRARQRTFQHDDERLASLRLGINEHFKKNKNETVPEKITQLYNDAITIEEELRTKIIQIEEINPGLHQLNITPNHCLENNTASVKKHSKPRK